jgi:hypothetical protein
MAKDESSIPWQYTKGLVLSYMALATALIKAEAITAEDVIKEIDMYIDIFTERFPDDLAIIETMKMAKDGILNLYSEKTSGSDPFIWLSGFTGNA